MSLRTDPPSPAAVRGAGPSPIEGGAEIRPARRGRWTGGGFAARCAPALAAGLALAALAVFQADRASAAETAFLALWVTAALLPAAALAPAPGWEAVLGAPLAVLAVWALPAGPARLAAVALLLVAVLAVAGGRAVARAAAVDGDAGGGARGRDGGWTWAPPAPEPPPGGAATGLERGGEPFERRRAGWGNRVAALAPHAPVILPLALGAQVLLRSELLLSPDARSVALLIVAPAVAAPVLGRLAALAGLPAALIAGAAAVTLGPGFTLVTTLVLLGVAGGAEIAASIAGRERSWLALAVPAAGLALGLVIETRATVAALIAGGLLVLAARGHREARAPARELAGVSRDRECREGRRKRLERRRPPASHSVVTGLSLLLVAIPFALRSLPEALALLSWLPLLVPALILPAVPSPARRWAPCLAAAALGWACAFAVPGPAAPAAALAVLALLAVAPPGAAAVGETAVGAAAVGKTAAAAAGGSAAVVRAVLTAQAVWSAALLAAAAVLASPPWLRPMPAAEGLALLGLEPGWLAAAAVVAAVLVLAAVGRSETGRLLRRPAIPAGGVLIAALLAALPAPGRPVYEGPAVVLSPERPRMAVELPGGPPAATVSIYTHLSNGLELPAGTEVADLALLDEVGRTLARRPLRAGLDTGEWAVRRPDVAALPGIEAPPPWATWIEGGGGPGGAPERPFFGQYYRALLEAEAPAGMAAGGRVSRSAAAGPETPGGEDEHGTEGAARLVIERVPELPAEVLLTVHRIEVVG